MQPDDVVRRVLELDAEHDRRRLLEEVLERGRAGDEALLVALKSASERYQAIDARASLRLAEALITAAGIAGRPEHGALGLMAKGEASRVLGHYEASLGLLDEAAASFLALGDEVGWARTRTGWIIAAQALGRAEASLEAVERARAILVKHEQWMRAAMLDLNTAIVCRSLGRYDQALALYERAQAVCERSGADAEVAVARVKLNKANVLHLLGDLRGALALHQEAGAVFRRHGLTISALREEHNVADVYVSQGLYTSALRRFGDVQETAERAGLAAQAALATGAMVVCYLRLNRDADALELGEEAVARFEGLGATADAARARFYCAQAHAGLGDVQRALALLEEADEAFAAVGLAPFVGLVALTRARLYLDAGDPQAALAQAERAHNVFAPSGSVVRQAHAALLRAWAHLATGSPSTAAGLAQQALRTGGERDALWLAHQGHHVLGAVAAARGDHATALAEYHVAIASLGREERRLATELRTHFLENKLQVFRDAIDCALRLGRVDLAFEDLERAKSRALVDYLTGTAEVRSRAGGGSHQAQSGELARLRAEHDWLRDRLDGHGLAGGGPAQAPTEAAARALREAIRDREKRIARVRERLVLREEGGRDVDGAEQPVLRPPLGDADVLVEYYLTADRAGAFVLTLDGLSFVPLTAGVSAVRRLLRRWQFDLNAAASLLVTGVSPDRLRHHARGTLVALYDALLRPVEAQLQGRKRLVVIPHGPAHTVPFHALHDGRAHLLERLEVVTCLSSSLLRLCVDRARHGGAQALVLGYSDGGRLPHAPGEARAVADLLGGECHLEGQATRAVLEAGAPRYGVVHLATHADARLDNPAFAYLRLAGGQFCTVDAFNLDLRGALVTLSACETGAAVVTGGDELIGLSRGFLHAGAATLVQSLWRVEDGSTADLMVRFYRALRAGLPKGAALREAQLGALATGLHPYFWAPFQLVGDDGAL